jgi:hypothetical protein
VWNELLQRAEISNVLDKDKLDFIYSAHCIRVTAVGINQEHREKRQERSFFNDWIRMAAEKYRKKRQRRIEKTVKATQEHEDE